MQRFICLLVVLVTPVLALADDEVQKEMKVLQGKWKTVAMEVGGKPLPKEAALDFTMIIGADGNSTEIFEGTVNGDSVAWKVSITNPMPLTLAFTGKVAGDSISGEMGIGPMGSFPFTGTRA